MELRVLKYFLEVAKEGNITRTAEHLHISQPTISKQIKDLEDELGVKLFKRTNYAVKLTEAGLLLRDRAEDIIELVNKTDMEFKNLDDIGGDIFIGAAESTLMSLFVEAVTEIQKRYPRIKINIFSGDSDDVCEKLDKGTVDIGVVSNYFDPKKYNYLYLGKNWENDTWGILMRKDDPLAYKESFTLDEVLKLPLICSRQWRDQSMSHWFKEKTGKLNIIATFNLGYNAAIMVKEKLGYALIFDDIVNTGEDSIYKFVPISGASHSCLNIIWRKNQTFTPTAKLLMNELESRFSRYTENQ